MLLQLPLWRYPAVVIFSVLMHGILVLILALTALIFGAQQTHRAQNDRDEAKARATAQ